MTSILSAEGARAGPEIQELIAAFRTATEFSDLAAPIAKATFALQFRAEDAEAKLAEAESAHKAATEQAIALQDQLPQPNKEPRS